MSIEAKLAELTGFSEGDIEEANFDLYGEGTGYNVGSEEWVVMTDEEADRAWDEALDSYLDDCILPELSDNTLARYFDRDAWKRDARHDGRGYRLSSYDWEEHEIEIDGETLYAYRVN